MLYGKSQIKDNIMNQNIHSIVEDMQSITLTILVLPWWIRVFLFLLVYLLTQRILYRLIGRYATSLTISFVVATASIYLFIQDTSVWFVMYSIPLPFYLLVTNFVRVDTSLSVLGQNKDRANTEIKVGGVCPSLE